MNLILKYDDNPYLSIEEISVIGSFNNHDAEKGKMSKVQDGWIYEIELQPGEYRYKFLLNNELQLNDPYNNLLELDENQNIWSIIIINDQGQRLYNVHQNSVHIEEYLLSSTMAENDKMKKDYDMSYDKKVVARFHFRNITGLNVITAVWYTPSGKLFQFADNLLFAENENERVTLWFWIEMRDVLDKIELGTWCLKLFIDGQYILEDLFTIDKKNSIRLKSQYI